MGKTLRHKQDIISYDGAVNSVDHVLVSRCAVLPRNAENMVNVKAVLVGERACSNCRAWLGSRNNINHVDEIDFPNKPRFGGNSRACFKG
jgi:hypothetical protein